MRSPWFAVSSLVLCLALAAPAETRPHYGGVLRIETQQAIMRLPSDDSSTPGRLAQQVAGLIFNTHAVCGGICKPAPGPFKVDNFVPGKKLTLVASDQFEEGRPFLDSIEITMGRAPRDQMLDLQLGRADVIEVQPETIRRAQQDGSRIAASAPIELVAIVLLNEDPKLREALALSVDRAAIFNVLLGRQGAPSAALLPNWMTGYGFVFDSTQDIARAKLLRQQSQSKAQLVLTYDPQDTLARSIAERVALDARAAGIAITPTTSVASPDAKLVRILLPSTDPNAALSAIAAAVGASAPEDGKTPEEWFAAERELRDKGHIIPLLHLPVAYGLSPRVKDWPVSKTGAWSLEQVWLEQKP